jgi:transmembrane sensor
VNAASNTSKPRDPIDWPRESGLGAELRAAVGERVRQKKRRRRTLQKSAAAGLALLGFLFWAIPYAADVEDFSTATAQRTQLALSDGSIAELNAGTTLETDFRYRRRLVRLTQGEAFFDVAKDPEHPFVVHTPHERIEVTGTSFNVRLDSDGHAAVTLLEGRILVHDGPAATALSPGQQRLPSGDTRPLSERELASVTAWRSGLIILSDLTLGEAAARYCDFHGCTISVDPSVSELRLGGALPLDKLSGFFDSLEEALPLTVTRRGNNSYHIGKR